MDRKNWKRNIFIIGGIVGAITGIGAAYIIIQRSEQNNTHPSMTAGEGVKIGLGVLSLLRLISDTGK